MSIITLTELDATNVEVLPKRETLSWRTRNRMNASSVWALNGALAVNNQSIFADATAVAGQSITVTQS